ADLMLCRAAAALAGWDRRADATVDDLRRVAPLVLAHRRRRQPFDEPGVDDETLDDAFANATAPTEGRAAPEEEVVDPDDELGAPPLPRAGAGTRAGTRTR